MVERVTALEEGLFGLTRVKLGANAKEHGVMLRSLSSFRKLLFTAIAILTLALASVGLYWQRATQASVALRAHQLHQRAIECREVIEALLLKHDEIDELARRWRQRKILDDFLKAERGLEIELQKRVSFHVKNHSAGEELERAFKDDLRWFTDKVGDAVEQIIAPMDSAFKYIPARIKTLQAEIEQGSPAFQAGSKGLRPGICASLTLPEGDVALKAMFLKRMSRLAELGQNASVKKGVLTLEPAEAAVWASLREKSNPAEILDSLAPRLTSSLLRLLKWYTKADPEALTDVLVPAQLSPAISSETKKFIQAGEVADNENDGEFERERDDDADDDNDLEREFELDDYDKNDSEKDDDDGEGDEDDRERDGQDAGNVQGGFQD